MKIFRGIRVSWYHKFRQRIDVMHCMPGSDGLNPDMDK